MLTHHIIVYTNTYVVDAMKKWKYCVPRAGIEPMCLALWASVQNHYPPVYAAPCLRSLQSTSATLISLLLKAF